MKKTFVRIFAVLGCVILLFALTIPAFADEPITAAVDYGYSVDTFNSMLSAGSDTVAYQNLFTYYHNFGDSRFFTIPYVVSGTSSSNVVTLPFTLNVGTDTINVSGSLPVGAFSYALYIGNSSPYTADIIPNGRIAYILYADDQSGVMIELSYKDASNNTVFFTRYRDYVGDNFALQLESLSINGVEYINSETYFEIAFSLGGINFGSALSLIMQTWFEFETVGIEDVLYSPKQFYYGINDSYSLGYDNGFRYGFDAGYEDAISSGDAYQEGYNAAVNQINDGDFGKNFLGNVFSAPIRALNEFTIISYDGIEITLGGLFGAVLGAFLFIWFLKMFAGG